MKMSGDFTNGPRTIAVDPAKPNEIYAFADHDGAWKSTDCGVTYTKVSTGTNKDKLDTGGPWGLVIDPNPNRDPETAPALYVNQGYGANGLWKSTDGGVNWNDVWVNNVYAEDGTAYGRETAYVAIHQYHRLPHQRYFAAFEQIAKAAGGRPHWGKLHTLGVDELRARYPRYDDFLAVRDRLDPQRVFANRYTRQVFGS
jgi:hypothetical protein